VAATPLPLLGRLLAEFLVAGLVIGSGIAVQKPPNDVALQLLENAAIAPGLFAIVLMFGPLSGGHPDPLVLVADLPLGGIRWRGARCHRLLAKAGIASSRGRPSRAGERRCGAMPSRNRMPRIAPRRP
jgi:hypothetical protein